MSIWIVCNQTKKAVKFALWDFFNLDTIVYAEFCLHVCSQGNSY